VSLSTLLFGPVRARPSLVGGGGPEVVDCPWFGMCRSAEAVTVAGRLDARFDGLVGRSALSTQSSSWRPSVVSGETSACLGR
jgi:hypothetical protein